MRCPNVSVGEDDLSDVEGGKRDAEGGEEGEEAMKYCREGV